MYTFEGDLLSLVCHIDSQSIFRQSINSKGQPSWCLTYIIHLTLSLINTLANFQTPTTMFGRKILYTKWIVLFFVSYCDICLFELFFFLNDGELDMHDKPSFLQKMNSSLVLIVLTLGLFSSSTAMLVKLFWSWDPFIFLEIIQNSPKSCSSGSPCFRVKLRNV